MVVSIAAFQQRTLYRLLRPVAALGASGFAALLSFDLVASAQTTPCNLGKTCTVDVTATADFPGFGTATQVTPLEVDLTELNADGSGKVTGVVPEGAVTFDLDKKTKTVSTKRKKGKRVTTFKPDKKAKAGVKVKASKPR